MTSKILTLKCNIGMISNDKIKDKKPKVIEYKQFYEKLNIMIDSKKIRET